MGGPTQSVRNHEKAALDRGGFLYEHDGFLNEDGGISESWAQSAPRFESLRVKLLRTLAAGLLAVGACAAIVKGPETWEKLNAKVEVQQTLEERVVAHIYSSKYPRTGWAEVTRLFGAVAVLPERHIEAANEPQSIRPGIVNFIILRAEEEGTVRNLIAGEDASDELQLFDPAEFTGFCAAAGTKPEVQKGVLGFNNLHGGFAWPQTAYHQRNVDAAPGLCVDPLAIDEISSAFERAVLIQQ